VWRLKINADLPLHHIIVEARIKGENIYGFLSTLQIFYLSAAAITNK